MVPVVLILRKLDLLLADVALNKSTERLNDIKLDDYKILHTYDSEKKKKIRYHNFLNNN